MRSLTDAFRRFITATFAERFDGFGGENFEVQGAKPTTGGMLVENHLVKPDGERIRINYLTHQTANGWEAVDVYLDGTIGELAVRRSEFTSILSRSGPERLHWLRWAPCRCGRLPCRSSAIEETL